MSGGLLTTLRPWSPPGPVAAAAFASWASPLVLQGPVGSGKTGTFIWKAVAGTFMQTPWADGVRRARLLILRDDYRRLWNNFIPSWLEWLPKHDPENGVEWLGSAGGPASQVLTMQSPDGKKAILEVLFMALGDDFSEQVMEDFFTGLQATWIWFNEWHTIPFVAFDKALQRVGRYPRSVDARVIGPGVWGDCNAPIVDTWHHLLITGGRLRPGISYFRQPGGDEAGAENTQNLYPGYYEKMRETMSAHEYERKVRNRFGRRLDGEPVYEFDDATFVAANELAPDLSRVLLIGMDAGLDPAAVLGQRRADQQLRRLAAIVSEHGVGPERFGRRLGQLLDTPRFALFRKPGMILASADPSASYGVDKVEGESNWIERVEEEAGIRIRPAETNNAETRRQAVRDTLKVIEGVPMALFDPVHCAPLRQAYNGGYRWRKMKTIGVERYDPEPEKNQWSHVADADQYLSLLEGGFARAKGREPSDSNAVLELMRNQGLIATPQRDDRRRGAPSRPMIIPR
jgi:hypothetical protein